MVCIGGPGDEAGTDSIELPTSLHVGPQQLAVAAVPGPPDLTPWGDDLGPDAHEPSGLQEQRWLQDLMDRQYEQVFERSWGIETPLSRETAPLTSQTSGATLPGMADATFDAQVNSLIQAMAAFAPPPMESFAPSSEQQTGALAPVLAVSPF